MKSTGRERPCMRIHVDVNANAPFVGLKIASECRLSPISLLLFANDHVCAFLTKYLKWMIE